VAFDEWVDPNDATVVKPRFQVKLAVTVPPDVQHDLGIEMGSLTMTDTIWLDVSPSGGLDYGPGKNSKLRSYRVATGNNQKGKNFSPSMLAGSIVTVRIEHNEYPKGSGELFERVRGVAKG
jgi:hypothetical protein